MLCLIETDLHSKMSRQKRRSTLTRKNIENVLGIPGYQIYLPATWKLHGHARLLVYAKDELKVRERQLDASLTDLPMLTFEIGFGMEKRTIVNYFYREFTSGVTGLKTTQDQMERLKRMIRHWESLASSNKDLVFLGDANICAKKWNDESYYLKDFAEVVQTFLLETECCQLVKEFTRSEVAQRETVARSCIDHVYSNAVGKVSTPEVVAVGSSDHLGVIITKYTKAPQVKPKVVQKRSYKNFNVEEFLKNIHESTINSDVTAKKNIEDAALEFETAFKEILDMHAPIKVFQMRKNYSPYLSDATKELIKIRNSWKQIAVKQGYRSAEKIAKEAGKAIKKSIANDKKIYFNKDFSEGKD